MYNRGSTQSLIWTHWVPAQPKAEKDDCVRWRLHLQQKVGSARETERFQPVIVTKEQTYEFVL